MVRVAAMSVGIVLLFLAVTALLLVASAMWAAEHTENGPQPSVIPASAMWAAEHTENGPQPSVIPASAMWAAENISRDF